MKRLWKGQEGGQDGMIQSGFILLSETTKKKKRKNRKEKRRKKKKQMKYMKQWFSRYWISGKKNTIPWKSGNKELSPITALAYFLDRISTPRGRQGEPRWSPVDSLSWRDTAESPGRPKLLEFTGPSTRKARAAQEKAAIPHKYSTEYWSAGTYKKTILY